MPNKRVRALIVIYGLVIMSYSGAQEELPSADVTDEVTPTVQESSAPQPVQESTVQKASSLESSASETLAEPTVEPIASDAATETAVPSEQDDIEIKGIDTVDIAQPKGNWLYKRIWWEKAEHLYEKIKRLANEISESRIVFFLKRHDLDRTVIDPFYLSLGLEQGALEEITAYLTAQLEQDRSTGQLNETEQQLLDTITQEKKTLEQLGQGSQRVTKLVTALEDALLKLLEQLNQARNYEELSWKAFTAINRELSDKRARELYYNMDTYWKNLNNINTYLSDSYTKYFEQLTDKVKEEVNAIQGTIHGLQEKGIDIKAQAQKLRTGCKVPATSEPSESEESTGLFARMWGWVKAPFAFIAELFSGLFGGGDQEEVTLLKPVKATQESIDVEAEAQEDQQEPVL